MGGRLLQRGARWHYSYDPYGRRICKQKITDGNTTHNDRPYGTDHLRSGDQLIEETPVYADGTPVYEESIHWLYEPGALTPVARSEKGRLHYLVSDHMGTPRELLTEQGDVAWSNRLSTWGKSTRYHHAANDDVTCNLRFAGQYADEESGLHYNRHRYYDSDTGQYLSPDPIGLEGGVNPYGYVHNPMGWVDPLGLACCEAIKAKSRNDALRRAQEHAQVPRVSRGGQDIKLNDLNPTSRGDRWRKMKADGAQKLGRSNPNGKNQWFEHTDGHPDSGLPDIPKHHDSGHIHSTNTKGEEVIFTW